MSDYHHTQLRLYLQYYDDANNGEEGLSTAKESYNSQIELGTRKVLLVVKRHGQVIQGRDVC